MSGSKKGFENRCTYQRTKNQGLQLNNTRFLADHRNYAVMTFMWPLCHCNVWAVDTEQVFVFITKKKQNRMHNWYWQKGQ